MIQIFEKIVHTDPEEAEVERDIETEAEVDEDIVTEAEKDIEKEEIMIVEWKI